MHVQPRVTHELLDQVGANKIVLAELQTTYHRQSTTIKRTEIGRQVA